MDLHPCKENNFTKKNKIRNLHRNIFFPEQNFNIYEIFFIAYEIFVFVEKLKFVVTENFFHLKNIFPSKKIYSKTNKILSVLTEIFWYHWNIFQFY